MRSLNAYPGLCGVWRSLVRPRRGGALLVAGLCVGLVSCGGMKQIKLLTKPQEMAVGQMLADSVSQQYPILHDPVIEWYLNVRGNQLAQMAGGPEFPYEFKVINTWELNAFSLPGGHVFINLGMIESADNEGELLGVVAHEIGHVVERHANEQVSQQALVGVAGTLVFNEYYNQWAYLTANLFTTSGFLKMSRDDEREADHIAVSLLTKDGYDPTEMTAMFQKLIAKRKRDPNLLDKLWSTHPPSEERIRNVTAEIESMGLDTAALIKNSPEFEMLKKRIAERYPKPKNFDIGKGKWDDEDADGKGDHEDTEPPDKTPPPDGQGGES